MRIVILQVRCKLLLILLQIIFIIVLFLKLYYFELRGIVLIPIYILF